MKGLLWIAAGGALGSLLRYLAAGLGQRLAPGLFPAGTLLVNVAGCLAIGFLAALFAGPVLVREEYRLALLVGLLGGFTTFSTFGLETLALIEDREWGQAALNVALSNGLGIAAVFTGARLAARWSGT